MFSMYQRRQNHSPVLAICFKTAMLHLLNLIICIKFPCISRSISSSLIIYDSHWSLIGGLRLSLQSRDLLGEADFGGVGYSVEWERRRHSKCNSLTHFLLTHFNNIHTHIFFDFTVRLILNIYISPHSFGTFIAK